MNCFDPFYWLSEKMHWSGVLDAPRGLGKTTTVLFEKLKAVLQSGSHSSSLQVIDEQ
jgi:hypothetical protein